MVEARKGGAESQAITEEQKRANDNEIDRSHINDGPQLSEETILKIKSNFLFCLANLSFRLFLILQRKKFRRNHEVILI